MNRLRRMFSRIRMDQMEVNIMRGFLTSVNKLHAGKSDKSAVVKNRNGE